MMRHIYKNKLIKVISCITIVAFLATSVYAETGSCLRVPLDRKANNERILNLIRDYLNTDKISIDFIPKEDLPQVPNFSLKRAWAHKYKTWEHGKVFKVPLFYSDHVILSILSLFIVFSAGLTLLLFNWDTNFLSICYKIFAGLFVFHFFHFTEKHLKEIIDSHRVFNRAKRYIKNSDSVTIRERAINHIKYNMSFFETTGWRLAFTDSPYVLFWPQLDKKIIVTSIGYFVDDKEKGFARIIKAIGYLLYGKNTRLDQRLSHIVADKKKRDRVFEKDRGTAHLSDKLGIVRKSIEELGNNRPVKPFTEDWINEKVKLTVKKMKNICNNCKRHLVFI